MQVYEKPIILLKTISIKMLSILKKHSTGLCIFLCAISAQAAPQIDWSKSEIALLQLQWINNLPDLPPDPGNKYADNPAAALLGQKLFFDKRFSANEKVSCATCHLPEKSFTDGLARSRGIGETSRSAPSIIGIAYSPWFFWDGRSDSLWSQALGPLESTVEHGGNRYQYARIIYSDTEYREMYEPLFGPLPDLADQKAITRVYVNIGKSIAAYERLLKPGPSRFDNYVAAILKDDTTAKKILSLDEVAGLKLFIGKAMCISCHQGPLFTNHGFHNVAAPDPAAKKPKYMLPLFYALIDKPAADSGRFKGIQLALESEFNCLSEYSDADDNDCAELKFANKNRNEIIGAFKVPTLRNITKTAPYMHAGQFTRLTDVLKHYNTAPRAAVGHSELLPINLTQKEREQIEAFLHSLSSPPDVAAELLHSPGK